MTTYNFWEITALITLALFSLYIILRWIVVSIKKKRAKRRHYDSL